MTNLSVADIKADTHYQLLDELGHKDLAPFCTKFYWHQRSWVTWAHYLLSVVIWMFWIEEGIQQKLAFSAWIQNFGYAVICFVALVPIHEALHGAAYKAFGASDVRYNISLRQFYAYAIAHHFVADRREFTWVALTPFVVINSLLILAAVFWSPVQFLLLGVLLVHKAGTSGDFAMLNYLWLNRHQDVFTYDDAISHTSYFYARYKGQPKDS